MVAFIKQEAVEKAREIRIKADEEFAIEKAKIVREECAAIDASAAARDKQFQMKQQIQASQMSNKSRLEILTARQSLLDKIFDDARKRLSELTKDKSKYTKLLEDLIVQGLFIQMETAVSVKARKQDWSVLESVIKPAIDRFQKETSYSDVTVTIDKENPLDESSGGGIIMKGISGKIEVDNTLVERLSLLEDDALPSIRMTLFGKSKSRRFYD